jgi:hypothetical protein
VTAIMTNGYFSRRNKLSFILRGEKDQVKVRL